MKYGFYFKNTRLSVRFNCSGAIAALLTASVPTVTCVGTSAQTVVNLTTPSAWVNVTNTVGGPKWGAYGVTYMKAVPGTSEVIAGVSENGLWDSFDDGDTWTKLGGSEITNRPGRIVFDPRDPQTFWESGCYGPAPFVTHDDGKTFQRLGNLAHADGIAVDFTDRKRQTLLLGLHEQSQSLQESTNGGNTWALIGDRLPANSNHSSDPIILNSKTYIINTAGWKQNATFGIYRSTDAGATWTQVSTFGPAGEPLVTSNGTIYWQRIWGGGLLKSTDKGETWQQISNAVKSNPIALPGNRLAGINGNQVVTSSDGGETWLNYGPTIPFAPNGITYNDKTKSFFAWQMSDNMTRQPLSIVRFKVD